MGMDAYLVKGRKIVCPKCGEVCDINWDKECEDLYFRNDHDLHDIIQHNFIYDVEEYDKVIEIDRETLMEIIAYFSKKQGSYQKADKLLEILGYLMVDEDNTVGYVANW